MIGADTNSSTIRSLIAKIDTIIAMQLKEIFNNDQFKELLSIWSCVNYLLTIKDEETIKIKIFDFKLEELQKLGNTNYDLDNFISRKILDEQDTPGQEPLSLLITSYILDVANATTINILDQIAQICSYTFIPFLAGINFNIFDAADLSDLERFSIGELSKSNKFIHLTKLAKQYYSNFIGLVLPKIYFPSLLSKVKSKFEILINTSEVILGSGAFAVAMAIMKSFSDTSWFLDIVGVPDQTTKPLGAIQNLVKQPIFLEKNLNNFLYKANAEFFISEIKEKELSDAGFISLCQMKHQNAVVLHNIKSLKTLDKKQTQNENLDAANTIQYLLCVCRFAHYIKIIGRTKIGNFTNLNEFQNYMETWLTGYVASNLDVSPTLKRQYPLLSAKIVITDDTFLNHKYQCKIYLKPHLVSMEMAADIVLQTSINAPN